MNNGYGTYYVSNAAGGSPQVEMDGEGSGVGFSSGSTNDMAGSGNAATDGGTQQRVNGSGQGTEADDESHEEDGIYRPRRINRACVNCRSRKIKCRKPDPNGPCEKCKAEHLTCKEPVSKRIPQKSPAVLKLEDRVRRLEAYIKNIDPSADLENLPPAPNSLPQRSATGPPALPGYVHSPSRPNTASTSTTSASSPLHDELREEYRLLEEWSEGQKAHPTGTRNPTSPADSTSSAVSTVEAVINNFDALSIDSARYIGKSSPIFLAESIAALRMSIGDGPILTLNDINPLLDEQGRRTHSLTERMLAADLRRCIHESPLPPPDLADELISLYFEHVNPYHPILHKPSFMRAYQSSLIDSDRAFRALIFAVFAAGARFSDDPRVLPDSTSQQFSPSNPNPNPAFGLSPPDLKEAAGAKYKLAAIHLLSPPLLLPASLFDLQALVLLLRFLFRTTSFMFAWGTIGTIVRRFVDVGAHRLHSRKWESSFLANQLRIRAWWSLYNSDRHLSLALGRPLSIQDCEFDVGLPMEISDEDMDRVEFGQIPALDSLPPDYPSMNMEIATFNNLTKLSIITTQAYPVVNSIRPNPTSPATARSADGGPSASSSDSQSNASWRGRFADEEAIKMQIKQIALMDSQLNAWLAGLPNLLKWPSRDPKLTVHAAILVSYFYCAQILIHRVFISATCEVSVPPSLPICVNAARNVSRVLRTILEKGLIDHIDNVVTLLSSAALIILLNIYGSRSRETTYAASDGVLSDLQNCGLALDAVGKTCFTARRVNLILNRLTRANDPPEAGPSTNVDGLPARSTRNVSDDPVSVSRADVSHVQGRPEQEPDINAKEKTMWPDSSDPASWRGAPVQPQFQPSAATAPALQFQAVFPPDIAGLILPVDGVPLEGMTYPDVRFGDPALQRQSMEQPPDASAMWDSISADQMDSGNVNPEFASQILALWATFVGNEGGPTTSAPGQGGLHSLPSFDWYQQAWPQPPEPIQPDPGPSLRDFHQVATEHR